MGYILGIDTGGTFTDAVIIEEKSKKIICKAKSPTTKENLDACIDAVIEALKFSDYSAIEMVVLSTTLATNAVVEGKGSEIGLIVIGEEIEEELPTQNYIVVRGGHDAGGYPAMELGEEMIRQALHSFQDRAKAIAISSYFSIRNPEHELRARQIVQASCNLPVVCAHELTTQLGFQHRTVTAALNAKLIPFFKELWTSLENVIRQRGMTCPIMTVKSDGSISRIEHLRERPVETILSGPAASIMGAFNLTGKKNALVVDVGGTTTDIALIKNSEVKINPEGALVGGWRTRVLAADVCTSGLGGDSYLKLDSWNAHLSVGPKRVIPLSYAAHQYPALTEELFWCLSDPTPVVLKQKNDCFLKVRPPQAGDRLNSEEHAILAQLDSGPRSLLRMAQNLKIDPDFFAYDHLEALGIIAHISFTPTDIIHALAESTRWNCDAAILGAKMLAQRMGKNLDEFLRYAQSRVVNCLANAVLQAVINNEGQDYDLSAHQKDVIVSKILREDQNTLLTCQAQLAVPVIAIGAPVPYWLPKLKEIVDFKLIIPEHTEVANAYGAATGNILEKLDILIKPNSELGGHGVHLPWEYVLFDDFEEAVAFAKKEAQAHVRQRAIDAGAENPQVTTQVEEMAVVSEGVKIVFEVHVKAKAIGRPMRWQ